MAELGEMTPRPPDSDAEPLPDPVDEALVESFPASDPPAWAGGRTIRDRPDEPEPTTPRRSAMARGLPTPFRFNEDPSWAAGPFVMLQREMNRLLQDVARGSPPVLGEGVGQSGALIAPRMDVRETDDAFRISVELPGVSEEEVDVEVDDDLLTVRAEKQEERDVERADQHITERMYGVFQRTIRLPVSVDPQSVQASMENGVLQIVIPKPEARQARNRRVPVGRRDQGSPSAAPPPAGDGVQAASQVS
jgi:HSP20 family protein